MAARRPRAKQALSLLAPPVRADDMFERATWERGEKDAMATAIGNVIRESLAELREQLASRIACAESNIALLQDRSNVRWAGTWSEHLHARAGELVTHSGSLFLCLRDSTGRPGRSEDFRLIVKAGRAPR